MRIRAAIAVLPLLLLAACASGTTKTPSATGTAKTTASAPASGTAAVSPAATLGPAVPAATVVAPAVPASEMPTVAGKAGAKPTLTFPKSNPPPSLQRQVLSEGTGPTIVKGDYLVTNYLGQIWGGKVFDNSYDRKTTATFQIGMSKVVPGWDTSLVGLKVGSRVLVSLPPADGYGSAGSPSAGIKGTDTIVFVIEIESRISATETGQVDAKVQVLPKGLPTVTGAPGKAPKLTIGKGIKEPTKSTVYVIAKGTGPAVKAGSVLAQLVVSDWAASQVSSTWPDAPGSAAASTDDPSTKGLQEITVDPTSPIGGLVGVPMGSRVLVLIPASTDQSTGQASSAAAAVVDLVAQAATS